MRRPDDDPEMDETGHVDEGTIHAWLDGALGAGESARVEAHVAICEACAEAVAEARGLIAGASRILGKLDATAGSARPAVARGPVVEPAGDVSVAPLASRRRFPRVERALAGLAAAAVIGAVGLSVLRERPGDRGAAIQAEMSLAIPSDSTVRAERIVPTSEPAGADASASSAPPAARLMQAPLERADAPTAAKSTARASLGTAGQSALSSEAPPTTQGGRVAADMAPADASRRPAAVASGTAGAIAAVTAPTVRRAEPEMRAAADGARRPLQPLESSAMRAKSAPAVAAEALMAPPQGSRCYAILIAGTTVRLELQGFEGPAGRALVSEAREDATAWTGSWRREGSGLVRIGWRADGERVLLLDPVRGSSMLATDSARSAATIVPCAG